MPAISNSMNQKSGTFPSQLRERVRVTGFSRITAPSSGLRPPSPLGEKDTHFPLPLGERHARFPLPKGRRIMPASLNGEEDTVTMQK
jgi:hypothetical protein